MIFLCCILTESAGLPKPYVHLLPHPLSLALDARQAGSEARFARSGCWPNAVLRPVLCERNGRDASANANGPASSAAEESRKNRESPGMDVDSHPLHGGGYDPTMPPPPIPPAPPWSDGSASKSASSTNVGGPASQPGSQAAEEGGVHVEFALFALRDLKASEEIVLGWEWDDGSVVHEVPALIEMFCAGNGPRDGASPR